MNNDPMIRDSQVSQPNFAMLPSLLSRFDLHLQVIGLIVVRAREGRDGQCHREDRTRSDLQQRLLSLVFRFVFSVWHIQTNGRQFGPQPQT